MEAIQTLINALVVGVVGLILARMTHNLRQEVKGEVADLRAEMKGEIGELRAEMREMRSDLTRVALAVGAEPRTGRQQP